MPGVRRRRSDFRIFVGGIDAALGQRRV